MHPKISCSLSAAKVPVSSASVRPPRKAGMNGSGCAPEMDIVSQRNAHNYVDKENERHFLTVTLVVESRKKRRIHIENWFYDNIIGKPSDCQQKKTTIVRTKSQLFFRGESLCKDERRLKTLVSFHFPCGHLSSLLPIRPMCYGSQDHPQSDPVSQCIDF